ncbi:hypothetical protein SPBR_04573 [Sporothrix brasiliensis 5110]|uniref:DUF3824 domain-containing protein n=1 Tax=Sporothrix brasiliensis 5110 TaxID=1398154 RepID=A0A0C2ILS3_9PEZI|nr:uncharacterized protein SPBR_04573 [Sporothrix brasiliensis 5110]KIH87965.1 hypothetical protein SPBR_04573 [Sporothrix brasiliensis 5110]
MPETEYYESTYRRDRERDTAYSSDDDDRYKKTTVRRYKVGSGGDRVERVERTTERHEDDSSSRHGRPARRSSNNLLDVDRHDYVPERPRSAFEVTETTRRSERDRDYYGGRDGGSRVVYEKTKEIDRGDRGDRGDRRNDRETRLQRRTDDQIVVESYSEDRRDDGHGGNVERWHRETEYYEPAPAAPQPIVIRQEAPAPAPIILPRQQPGVVVIREKDRDRDRRDSRHDDEYFYERRERREVGPFRGGEEVAVERYERREGGHGDELDRRHQRHHHRDRRDHASDEEYSDDDYYVKKTTVIRRERSPSTDNHHRLHLAEGALAGAGLGALIGSRRNTQTGELPEHRGRKVLAGAALGALGTEVFKRAHSAYNERFGDDDGDYRARSRSRGGGTRSRSSSRHHSKLKTGLGLAAAALAVAGAAKYIQSNRIDKEERNRGRSLHRYSSGEEDYGHGNRSVSRTGTKSRSHSVAKVAAGTAAVAGLVHHFRSKSRQREGKARSHSRLRTGAEIAGAALAGAAAKKLYDKHKDKKQLEREQKEAAYYSDDPYSEDDRYSRHGRGSRSHSRNRSAAPSQSPPPLSGATRTPYPPSGADPELGLVEYGDQPLYADPGAPAGDGAIVGHRGSYDSAADASERDDRRARRRHRHPHNDRGGNDSDDADAEVDSDRKSKRERSRSRLRNLATAGAGAAAAAIGIKKYSDSKRKKEEEANRRDRRDHERDRDHDRDFDRDHDRQRDYDRDEDQLTLLTTDHRDDEEAYDGYYDDYDNSRPPSPPHASGGAFYPPAPPGGAPIGNTGGLMQHSNTATTNLNDSYAPYNPVDYSGYPPPPGPPPTRGAPDVQGGAPIPHESSSGPVPGPAPYPASYPSTPAAIPSEPVEIPPEGPILPGPGPASGAPPPPPGPPPPPVGNVYEAPGANANHNPNASGRGRGRSDDSTILNSRQPAAHDGDHVSFAVPLNTVNDIEDLPAKPQDAHEETKTVGFAPLSPQSSRTLRRHHAEVPHSHRRPADDDDAVEELPDRFDSQGRLLGGHSVGNSSRFGPSSRHGDFEYRNPDGRPDGWHARGQWGIISNNHEGGVDTLADAVRGILDGIGAASSGSGRSGQPGLLGLVGGVLEGLSHGHEGGSSQALADRDDERSDDDDGKKRKRRNTYAGKGARDSNQDGDSARDGHRNDRHRERDRDRATNLEYLGNGFAFDRDGYDGNDARKRRRSWAN